MRPKPLTGTFNCLKCGNLWDGSELRRSTKPPTSVYEPTEWVWSCGFFFCCHEVEKVSGDPLPEDQRRNRQHPPIQPIAYL